MYIYKITNIITNKIYIGLTRLKIMSRFKLHIRNARNGKTNKLYASMRKYGYDNFQVSVIEEIDDNIENAIEVLNLRECYWILYYDATTVGYNILSGGASNPMDNASCRLYHDSIMKSEKVRKSISDSMKKYTHEHGFSDEHRKKISNAMKGNHNFGTGDTRSIGVYCMDANGNKLTFHSIKDATVWWFDNYKPYGDRYVLITLQRKIRKSIEGELNTTPNWFKI